MLPVAEIVSKHANMLCSANLGGAFAVWAASGEAAFVHGRFVWASWDVEELKKGDVRERIEADYDYLRIGVTGFKDSKRAAAYT